jgi:hypothetical protein
LLGDVNGDGKADAIIYYSGEWWVSLSDGKGFQAYKKWVEGHGVGSISQILSDVNGDGCLDALVGFYDEWWVSTSNKSGFNAYQSWK